MKDLDIDWEMVLKQDVEKWTGLIGSRQAVVNVVMSFPVP